jgi:hypothetical protein
MISGVTSPGRAPRDRTFNVATRETGWLSPMEALDRSGRGDFLPQRLEGFRRPCRTAALTPATTVEELRAPPCRCRARRVAGYPARRDAGGHGAFGLRQVDAGPLPCAADLDATSGEVEVEGRDIGKLTETELIDLRRKKMGMVFQSFGLLPHRTALENVAFPLEMRGQDRASRIARARTCWRWWG